MQQDGGLMEQMPMLLSAGVCVKNGITGILHTQKFTA
jgi:hypothetical protein